MDNKEIQDFLNRQQNERKEIGIDSLYNDFITLNIVNNVLENLMENRDYKSKLQDEIDVVMQNMVLDTVEVPEVKEKRKYRKKPIEIEAYQTDDEVVIETKEGSMTAKPGDFIITGVEGEQYPVDKNIFLKTYVRTE